MILIIVAESYAQYYRFVKSHWPELSRPNNIDRNFTYVVSDKMEEIYKVYDLERGQPVLYIGGKYSIVEHLRNERRCIEIRLVDYDKVQE